MEIKFMVKFLAWIPLFNAIFLSVMAIICFTLSYNSGDISAYLPLISETGITGPSLSIFMIGTMLSSISVAIIVLYKYLLLRYYIGSGKKIPHLYNSCACAIGLLSAFFLLMMTAFPLSLNKIGHKCTATPYFILCMGYTCMDAHVSGKVLPSRKQHRLRLFLCTAQTIFGVLFITVYPVAKHLYLKDNPLQNERFKDPSEKMFGFIFFGCLLEWLMYIAYILYLLTYTTEFLRFRLVLEAKPCSDIDVRMVSEDQPADAEHDVTDDVTKSQSETTPPKDGGSDNSSAETVGTESKSV